MFGLTDCQRGAGYWLVQGKTPGHVAEEAVERLKGVLGNGMRKSLRSCFGGAEEIHRPEAGVE